MTAADRERWDDRYRAATTAPRPGAPSVLEQASGWLGEGGKGLDIACGRG
ncbi:MAG: SAM-dependent methyltransferase, partial [Acidimicrobiia bacterium]|nr:SAM-dependent methyltransferase [Acidimicrobiia bacterium]